MVVFEVEVDVERYSRVSLGHAKVPTFNGREWGEEWNPPIGHHADGAVGDFAYLMAGCLACNARAKSAMHNARVGEIEWLPMEVDGQPWFVANVLDVVDCLDLDRSVVERYPSSGRVMLVERYAFRAEAIRGRMLFKIPELRKTYLFGTGEWESWITGSGLKGLVLRRLWEGGES